MVQRAPSSHVSPDAAGGFEQVPVDGSQEPAVWHASVRAQTTGSLPAQKPDWQVSVRVQAFPSLQPVPLGTGIWKHCPFLHTSSVHSLPSAAQAIPSGFAVATHPPSPSQSLVTWHSPGTQA
jgi:hypothetical protein